MERLQRHFFVGTWPDSRSTLVRHLPRWSWRITKAWEICGHENDLQRITRPFKDNVSREVDRRTQEVRFAIAQRISTSMRLIVDPVCLGIGDMWCFDHAIPKCVWGYGRLGPLWLRKQDFSFCFVCPREDTGVLADYIELYDPPTLQS